MRCCIWTGFTEKVLTGGVKPLTTLKKIKTCTRRVLLVPAPALPTAIFCTREYSFRFNFIRGVIVPFRTYVQHSACIHLSCSISQYIHCTDHVQNETHRVPWSYYTCTSRQRMHNTVNTVRCKRTCMGCNINVRIKYTSMFFIPIGASFLWLSAHGVIRGCVGKVLLVLRLQPDWDTRCVWDFSWMCSTSQDKHDIPL